MLGRHWDEALGKAWETVRGRTVQIALIVPQISLSKDLSGLGKR